MEANFKKFAGTAGTLFSRAKQFTEEKLGQAEKTELDAHFENLLQRSDKTKMWTERILKQTECVIQPNPSHRVEDLFYNKFDKRKPDRQTNTETLGQYMIESGNEFGPGTAYGGALVKCGQTEQKLGQAERDFMQSAANNFLQPLKAFLDGDMKTVQKERRLLETKRLDLDAAKNKLRRAKSQASKEQAEQELRTAQLEYDRQAEITKLLLEGISSTHAHHLRCLNDFIEAQMTFHAQCQQYLADLQRQLGSFPVTANSVGGGSMSPTIHPPVYPSIPSSQPGTNEPSAPPETEVDLSSPQGGSRKARVLYDYDAADLSELSLLADEVIMVYSEPGMDSDWMMGQRNNQKGRVPVTYLELLN